MAAVDVAAGGGYARGWRHDRDGRRAGHGDLAPSTIPTPGWDVLVASRLVNWLAFLCVVGGPVIGWAEFFAFTRGDLFGRDAIVGIVGLAVGLFGLMLFSGYSAFHVLTGRPGQAAILAVAYPALLLALALAGPRWVVSRPPLADAITENRLADGRLVRATRASPDEAPANALDRRVDTAWNAGTYAPAWIEIELGKPSTITEIRLLVAQSPAGETHHQVNRLLSGTPPASRTVMPTPLEQADVG